MGGDWYCSSRCFTGAAERKLTEVLAPGVRHALRSSRMPLGLILISRGLVTRQQLREATELQRESGEDIGDLLVRHGHVTEKQVTAARSVQWGCPVFSIPRYSIETRVRIPATFVEIFSAIPLHYVAATKRLLVGFVGEIEYGLLYAIEQITGCTTQPCFVTPSEFQFHAQQKERLSDKIAADSVEVMIEECSTPAELARTLCSYAVNLEADEAVIEKCRDYIWARLRCDSRESDLLFKMAL
jgi:hypothetical protein